MTPGWRSDVHGGDEVEEVEQQQQQQQVDEEDEEENTLGKK